MIMSKKIILIEDNGIIVDVLREQLSEYDVISAYSYSSAIDKIDENPDFIGVVIDMQINPNGLTPNENGIYTPLFGMAVINYLLNKITQENREEYKKKIIIYSGYTKDLKQKARNGEAKYWSIKDLTIIEKTPKSISDLIYKIKLLK